MQGFTQGLDIQGLALVPQMKLVGQQGVHKRPIYGQPEIPVKPGDERGEEQGEGWVEG